MSSGADARAGGDLPPPAGLRQLAAAVPATACYDAIGIPELVGGDAVVRSLAHDSRRVLAGSLFFALRGRRSDGHDHAGAAVAAGAAALVVERVLDLPVPQLVVRSVRAAMGPLAAAFYGHPSRHMAVVGVTGTNGKTTVCTVLRQALDAGGAPAGQVGTIGSRFGDRSIPTDLTTPQAPDVQWTLWQMRRAGVRAVAMEASSHGLDQRRLDGTAFDIGIFTNLTREHLDYHGTMERYLDAKALLFDPTRCRLAIVGVDDDWGRRLAARVRIPVVTFGRCSDADLRFEVCERGLDGITVSTSGPEGGAVLKSRLVGAVNGANVAAAYLAARRLGLDEGAAAAGIEGGAPPPGRFELVDAGQPFLVVVDYAHTPDALAALIGTARRLAAGRVTVVVGARGGRDAGKRRLTGRVAARADRVVLTTDSPGDEPGEAIIDALRSGVLEAGAGRKVVVEQDRRRAIGWAAASAGPGDVVLVVGRGHEQVQHVGEATIPFDDRVAAHDALVEHLGKGPGRCG